MALVYAPEARMLVPAGDPATAWTVILDPSAVAVARAELSINTGAIAISQDGIDWGQAAIDAYEAELQKWGSTVVDFRVPNRMVTINLLVGADNSGESGFIDAAMQLRQKVALFQREGGWIQRGFDVPMYADVVSAALTFADQYGETGFLESNVILTLECLPDFYGDEIELDLITCTGYCAAVLQKDGVQAVIDGDHGGRCRIVITDTSGHDQRELWWGFRSRHYDSDPLAKLALGYADLYTNGVDLPSAVTLSGAYAGHALPNVFLSSPTVGFFERSWALINPTPANLTHVGSYRVLARFQQTGTGAAEVKLGWGVGDAWHPVTNDIATLYQFNDFAILDLGVVRIDEWDPALPQGWLGAIESAVSTTGSLQMYLDEIWLQPLDESAGRLRVNEDLIGIDGDAVLFANQAVELRTDGVRRQSTALGLAGLSFASWGTVSNKFGQLPRIPPSGLEGRAVEIFVKPSRGATGFSPATYLSFDASLHLGDAGIDTFTVQVFYRPTYLFRP